MLAAPMSLAGVATRIIFAATKVSLAGAATSIIFVKIFVATNTCLSRQKASFVTVSTKSSFVATNTCLSRQTLAFFCPDKHVFVATKMFCRSKHTFVSTKIILMAAPANRTTPALKQMAPQFVRDYVKHVGLTH